MNAPNLKHLSYAIGFFLMHFIAQICGQSTILTRGQLATWKPDYASANSIDLSFSRNIAAIEASAFAKLMRGDPQKIDFKKKGEPPKKQYFSLKTIS